MYYSMDTPALNPNGSLKDASEIEFIHSPSQEDVILPPEEPSMPPRALTSIFSFAQPLGPQDATSILGRKRTHTSSDSTLTQSTVTGSGSTAKKPSTQKGKDGPRAKAKAKKPAAIGCLLSQASNSSAPSSHSASIAASEETNGDGYSDGDEVHEKK